MNWYRQWFGAEYLELYEHRSSDAAKIEIDALFQNLPQPPNGSQFHSALDVACGAGRHTIEIARYIPAVIGADLSEELLKEAALAGCQHLVHADMRELPFPPGSFELLTSLFNSFGYFEDDLAHLKLLHHWRELLVPSGTLVLDFFNRSQVISKLIPHSTIDRGEVRYEITRSLADNGRRIEKRITRTTPTENKDYLESVRLYSPEELTALLDQAGFSIFKTLGSFSGENFTAASSPQLLILATRAE